MEIQWHYSHKAPSKTPVSRLYSFSSRELPPVQAVSLLPVESCSANARIGYNNKSSSSARIEEIYQELDSLVGLQRVKSVIREIHAFVEIQQRRAEEMLATEPLVLHTIFKGNPGTGKTTVARLLARLFKELGILKKGHLVEVERADLVGEYIGHTAQKTREQIRLALGGVLFIDEAYSLMRGGEKDFGKESIDTLVRGMEEHKNDLIVILAGYREEMERFIRSNPGIRSRFPIHIDFPDYTLDELIKIADLMLSRRQYCLTAEARIELRRQLEEGCKEGKEHSGNARLVRNLIERAIRRQAVRLLNMPAISREDLVLIKQVDFL